MGILALTVVSLIASACDSDDPAGQAASAGGSTIGIRDYEFEPGTITVGVGDTVTFGMAGLRTTSSATGSGPPIRARASSATASSSRGTYPYGCTIHPGMNGSVIVQEESP